MMTLSQLVGFLRCHGQRCNSEQLPRTARTLFPAPDESVTQATFYAADERRRYYFEFLDTAGASHVGNIVLVPKQGKTLTLLSNRGESGEIWEAFLLPVACVAYVALRSKTGRL